jgi:hypothetical protein
MRLVASRRFRFHLLPCSILTCSAARVRRLGSFFQMDLPRDLFFPRRFTIASIGVRFAGNPWSKARLSGLKWTHFGGMKAA